jgi:dihydrofolate reductase
MSKVILYMVISADGFIAGQNDDVDWVSDESWRSYQDFLKECDVVLVGKSTYKLMNQDEFNTDRPYIIVTTDKAMNTGNYEKRAIVSAADLPEASTIGVVGGGELNGSLAELGVIDELILDVEPIVLGQGKRLFGNHPVQYDLKLILSKQLASGTIQNHYKLVK